jgi:uncharacterized membrane protein
MPERSSFKISGILIFIVVAAMVAGVLAEVTHEGLGISRHVVRDDALLTALLTLGLLLIGMFSNRLGSRK